MLIHTYYLEPWVLFVLVALMAGAALGDVGSR